MCCLGLPPESAMIAVVPLLHEIVPHGSTRMCLLKPDATICGGFAENPATAAILSEHMWRFTEDASTPMGLWKPRFQANAIGWTLHMQGRCWLDSGWYREVEAPLDSCCILDAMIGDGGQPVAIIDLLRPRGVSRFTVDDVQRVDRLRPWLAHAFRRSASSARQGNEAHLGMAGPPVLTSQLIVTAGANIAHQTAGCEHMLRIVTGEQAFCARHVPVRDGLPAPVLKLLRQITGAANGTSNAPGMRISTAYGVLTLEAQWLVPAGTLAEDAARDPKSCLIAVTIELREHPIAHAARALRESGATPAQTKVGIQLALGKTKPVIADELGIQFVDVTKKLYQNLDVHNSAELSTKIWSAELCTKIWLGQKPNAARQNFPFAG